MREWDTLVALPRKNLWAICVHLRCVYPLDGAQQIFNIFSLLLDEPYSQLTPLSGVAVQARQATWLEPCPSFVAWRAGMAAKLSWLS
jgi:hypothetical protein